MKNLQRYLIAAFVSLALSLPTLSAQTMLTNTTLSSAITSTSTTTIQVTSATGITAGSTVLYIADQGSSGEAVFVYGVNGTNLNVTRDYQNLGKARTHASGALVFIGPPYAFSMVQPSGSCTRASVLYLPDISLGLVGTPTSISDCVGGLWVTADTSNYSSFFRVVLPPIGAVAYSTPIGTNTTLSATTMYCSEIDVPASKYVTGLGLMNGATATTDKHLVALYDATGNLLANSATAGATASGANTFQTFAFTTAYYLVGPNKYYACAQTNGTTGTLNLLTTGEQDTVTTKGYTGQTFGTIPATITVPTTFTTVVGPYWELY